MTRTPADTAREWRQRRQTEPVEHPDLVIGIAASFTAEPIEAFLGMALVDSGWGAPEMHFGDYNQLHQLCLDPVAVLGQEVDYIVALWRIEDVFSDMVERYLGGDDEAAKAVIEGTSQLAAMFVQLAQREASVTVSTPPFPQPWGADLADTRLSLRLGRLHRLVLETWLSGVSASARLHVVDVDALVRLHGAERAVDEPKWALYHQPYSSDMWARLGSGVADVITRQSRSAPKCIVLDCDNTLWGGIVGEDGLSGIELGDVFPGSAFRTFQQRLRQLKEAGIMLAIASKNEPEAVREVFDQHDGMALSGDDIACWKVNWQPKSSNIAQIAAELNIGLDSLVFVDDSSYELAEVEAGAPDVVRLQVPEETAELPRLLSDSGLFRNLRVSDEDRVRTEMMLAESARKAEQSAMTGDEFLDSLELRVEYFAPREEHIGRVAQLTNKTNQFNLTTVRRTESEVASLVASPRHEVRAIRVADRFGDYGVVGVAVLDLDSPAWSVDTFLMSCRVLGRGVETAFLAAISEDAAAAGAASIFGKYIATPKNAQVADFYPRHGFEGDGEAFSVAIAHAPTVPSHIDLVR